MKYEIIGEPMPVVVCELAPGETMITEKGSMCWMSPNLEMRTNAGGGLGRAFGRLFSGESMFQTTYTAPGGPGRIAFASRFPGSIRAVEIDPARPIVVQKSGFLASEAGVELSVFFKRRRARASSAARASSCKSSRVGARPSWRWTVRRGIHPSCRRADGGGYRQSGHVRCHLLH